MPHTESAKKRLRQSQQRNMQNRSAKHAIKTEVRKVLDAVNANNATAAASALRVAAQKIDKAAARRILHPNNAARTKSRLASRVAALHKSAK